jgi:Xaa-Pro aminopeptidase
MVAYMGNITSRLKALRAELATRNLDGFFVPLTDEHQSEYVAPYAARLSYMTDFLGSAGSAILMKDIAAIFVDGRYKIQVMDEVDDTLYEICHLAEISPNEWLDKNIKENMIMGYDPSLHTIGWVKKTTILLENRGAKFTLIQMSFQGNPQLIKDKI